MDDLTGDWLEGSSGSGTEEEAKYLGKSVGACEAVLRNVPGLIWMRVSHFDKQIRVSPPPLLCPYPGRRLSLPFCF